MEEDFTLFVGVDLAVVASHQACVLDGALRRLQECSFEPTAKAITSFVESLLERAPASEIVVGVEAPHGAVVEALLERHVAVFHINPKQVDRFRERENVAGAKDDCRDARVLARALATDRHCFRRVIPDDPAIVHLRELSREREVIVSDLRATANRLRDQLQRYFPQALQLSQAADDRWLWALLRLAPTPAAAGRLKKTKVRELLRAQRIRRVQAEEVLEVLRQPPISVAAGLVEACSQHVRRLISTLETTSSNLREVERELRAAIDATRRESSSDAEGSPEQSEHRDTDILLSMPGVGDVVGATVLSEAAGALRDRDYTTLRALAGVAPVTKASGTKGGQRRRKGAAKTLMRRACNPRLRNAVHFWAEVASRDDAAARAHYRALRDRGKTHGRALRGVGDRLIRILVAALRSQTPYDPSRLTTSKYALAAA